MPVYRLHPELELFPHPLHADSSGILAVEGTLTAHRLINAYRHGIFPWFSKNEPIIWWFPNPRCVLWPQDLKISKSMLSVMRNKGFVVTINQNFDQVIRNCKDAPRPGQEGTWLDEEMVRAYNALHKEGYAHSVEVCLDGALVGGLYGIALGKIFFGESMFSDVSNASKVGFTHLVKELQKRGFRLIDCQQDTAHLRSLGATVISAEEFYQEIRKNHLDCLEGEKLGLDGGPL
jgi:leucyl/phenylalanyl-tRNA---protein transferase